MGLLSKFRKPVSPSHNPITSATVTPDDAEDENEKDESSGSAKVEPPTLYAVDVMADMIYRSCWPLGWFSIPVDAEKWSDQVITGVCLRSKYGSVRSCPGQHPGFAVFEEAVVKLNAKIAIKLQSKAVEAAMKYFM